MPTENWALRASRIGWCTACNGAAARQALPDRRRPPPDARASPGCSQAPNATVFGGLSSRCTRRPSITPGSRVERCRWSRWSRNVREHRLWSGRGDEGGETKPGRADRGDHQRARRRGPRAVCARRLRCDFARRGGGEGGRDEGRRLSPLRGQATALRGGVLARGRAGGHAPGRGRRPQEGSVGRLECRVPGLPGRVPRPRTSAHRAARRLDRDRLGAGAPAGNPGCSK